MGSVVDSYCKGCRYLGTVSGGKNCNYTYITGHSRGCPAGKGCIHHTNPKAVASITENPKEPKPLYTEKKNKRPPARSPEEAYEREKERRREASREFREKAHGRQKSVILAYKAQTGDSNYEISKKIGISESSIQKWITEYKPANWDKLAIIGVMKPEGL